MRSIVEARVVASPKFAFAISCQHYNKNSEGYMARGFLSELRFARRRFSVLALLLLVLPILFSLVPRPNQATADYIAGITGYTLCSPLGEATQSGREIPQNPCQNCVNGVQCPVSAALVPHIIEMLNPERIVSGTLRTAARPLQYQIIAAINAARGPPAFI
jgi:hypothetical protein